MATNRERFERTHHPHYRTGRSGIDTRNRELLHPIYAGVDGGRVRAAADVHHISDHVGAGEGDRVRREDRRNHRLDLYTLIIVLLAILMIEMAVLIRCLSLDTKQPDPFPILTVSEQPLDGMFEFDGQKFVFVPD